MQPHEREVTLKLNSRPLRLVYLVRNREDLINAVKLYTHVWGGAANAILPLPEDELEIKRSHRNSARRERSACLYSYRRGCNQATN